MIFFKNAIQNPFDITSTFAGTRAGKLKQKPDDGLVGVERAADVADEDNADNDDDHDAAVDADYE